MAEFERRPQMARQDTTRKVLIQEPQDLCPNPSLTCEYVSIDPQRYPFVSGGEGTLVVTSQVSVGNGACEAIAYMQPQTAFNKDLCAQTLDLLDNSSPNFPGKLHLGVRGGVLDIGGGADPNNFLMQINNYVGYPDMQSQQQVTGNEGQGVQMEPSDNTVPGVIGAPTNTFSDLGTVVTCASILFMAGAAIVLNRLSSVRRSVYNGEHPEAGIPRNDKTGKWSKAGEFPHTREDGEKFKPDVQKASERLNSEARAGLEDSGVMKRAPKHRSWPVDPEHSKDTEGVERIAQVLSDMGEQEKISLFYYVKKEQDSKLSEMFAKIDRYNKKRRHDGPTVVNLDLDHDFFLQGSQGVDGLLARFRAWREKALKG